MSFQYLDPGSLNRDLKRIHQTAVVDLMVAWNPERCNGRFINRGLQGAKILDGDLFESKPGIQLPTRPGVHFGLV